jgi:hypothetical protein
MIKSAEIRDALSEMIKGAVPEIKVYFNNNFEPTSLYAWVRLRPERRDEGFGMFVRQIQVDISIRYPPDEYASNYDTDLYEIADALDEATCGYIKILDRNITIYDTSAHIFDNVLHYEFKLDIADYIEKNFDINGEQEYELMKELQIKYVEE